MRYMVTMALVFVLNACAYERENESPSKLNYDPDKAITCPEPSETDRYLEVPVFYHLKEFGAKVENIANLKTYEMLMEEGKNFEHQEYRGVKYLASFEKKKIKLYFELAKPFDSKKPLFIWVPGGPGGDHSILHSFEKVFPWIFENYNVIAMDHRGVGCSQKTFPGEEPPQSLLMRYAASDIENIRRTLVGRNGKITVWGGSYGSMLAQTYALLYPDNIEKLILAGAFSEATDFNFAQKRFENLVTSSSKAFSENFKKFKGQFPVEAKSFLNWAVRPMYSYKGRTEIVPQNFTKYETAVRQGQHTEAKALLDGPVFVMPWMTRSISCIEIFKVFDAPAEEFPIFGVNMNTCSEYSYLVDYFNYKNDLKNISARTLLVSGFYDHVTPFDAMKDMAKRINNSYFHVDPHLGHDVLRGRKDCSNELLTAFLNNANDLTLKEISHSDKCQSVPQ